MDGDNGPTIPLTTLRSPNEAREPDRVPPEQLHHETISLECPLDSEATAEKTKEEKEAEEEEENQRARRIRWSSKKEYILSTIGYCVGLGNLFRFPYLCNRNGGGAFLIPFLMSLMLIGLPLFTIEVIMGQFSGRNCQQAWAICPLFKGCGLGTVLTSAICFWYYNTLLVWGFYYLACCFQSAVPWASCDNSWNTPQCFTYMENENTSAVSGNTSWVSGMSSSMSVNVSFGMNNSTLGNDTVDVNSTQTVTSTKLVSAAEEFWQHNVLQLSSGLGEPGSVVWYLAVALIVNFVICFFILVKGIRSSGKVAYVSATAPYILLTILLIRGALLPGAVNGIVFYITPDFAKLLQPQVWVEAALQVFYSLGPCWGGLIVMASFNKFHNNCLRDSLILTLVTEGTSIFGGLAIFSVLGYMAYVSGQDIEEVVSSGPGLAFIVYPEALSLMPLPQLWAVLFFLNTIALGIDSQMTHAEVTLTVVIDCFPNVLRRRRALVTAVFCCFFLLISLPFITQGGIYVFQLVDWFVAALATIVIGLIESVVVGWIYGVNRFGDDVYLMLGRRPPFILNVFWKFITPCLLLPLLLVTLVNYTPPTYGDYVYGPWGTLFGWCVALCSFLPIPTMAVYQLWKAGGSLKQRLQKTLKPDYNIWKPADAKACLAYQKENQQRI